MSPREIERLRSDFKRAMSVALTIFGDRAFSTLNDRQGWSPSANPVVFRILAPSFARYDKAVLIRNADDVPPFLYPLKRRVPVFYGLGLVG